MLFLIGTLLKGKGFAPNNYTKATDMNRVCPRQSMSIVILVTRIIVLLWNGYLCPHKTHLLESKHHCDGIWRWDLWEVIRS